MGKTLGYRAGGSGGEWPMSRWAGWGFGCGVVAVGMVLSWSWVVAEARYWNAFTVRLRYPGVEVAVLLVVAVVGLAAGVLGVLGWRATGRGNVGSPRSGRVFAAAAIVLFGVWGVGVGLAYPLRGYWRRDRYAEAVYAEQRNVERILAGVKRMAEADGKWPADWAAVVMGGAGVTEVDLGEVTHEYARRAFVKRVGLPTRGAKYFGEELKAYSDYVYAGADLPGMEVMGAEADQVIVVYGRYVQERREAVHVDGYSGEYMYGAEARAVGFASGRVRMVAERDLWEVMEASDVARGRWGLRGLRRGG